MSIAANIKELKARIIRAAESKGCDPSSITIVAVIKNVANDLVGEAIEAGLTDFGENRIQEAADRDPFFREKYPQITRHFIGHLQRNKVGQALDIFDIIQSVDSERLAVAIDRRAQRPLPILIEVNTSGERSKFGVEFDRAIELIRFASSQEKLRIQGLMTLGPLTDDPDASRQSFRRLKELKHKVIEQSIPGVEMKYLSMGMSSDFETAVEEGANLIRIGRAIFNQRS